jgi:hypothetical protein
MYRNPNDRPSWFHKNILYHTNTSILDKTNFNLDKTWFHKYPLSSRYDKTNFNLEKTKRGFINILYPRLAIKPILIWRKRGFSFRFFFPGPGAGPDRTGHGHINIISQLIRFLMCECVVCAHHKLQSQCKERSSLVISK